MKAIERRAEEKNRITNRDGEREQERERGIKYKQS